MIPCCQHFALGWYLVEIIQWIARAGAVVLATIAVAWMFHRLLVGKKPR